MTTALVVGRATTVWDDIAAAKQLGKIDLVLVTGPIAVEYPEEIDAWVWFHTELFEDYALRRARKGFPPAKSYWGAGYSGMIRSTNRDVRYSKWNGGGSSGLVAVMIALDEYKADKVVLAGIPMSAEGGQYDSSKLWHEAKAHRPSWSKSISRLRDKVKSFNGWTGDLLGTPTSAWLNDIHAIA